MSIFDSVPGLTQKMDQILGKYEQFHKKHYGESLVAEGESVNMSPYKDSIKNAETPKKKAAKKKIDELFRDR